jgi:hypothetical protein
MAYTRFNSVSQNKSAALTVSILAAIILVYEYPVLRFHGDGRIWGGPGFGYSIKMHRIPLDQPGEYVFQFRGVPSKDWSLQLYAEGETDKNRDELTHIKAILDATLVVDQNKRIVCQGSGMPGDGQNEHIWVLMSGWSEAAFWHWNCVHMPLKSSMSYTLDLGISDVGPNTPKIIITPVLESDQPVWP